MQPTPQYRPTWHFTPFDTWMNDPNGLVFHKGKYHLFFQNNPTGRTWGNIGWGHAVSSDLLEWEELPLAIPAEGEEMAFSGSVVWDRNNSSGLGTSDSGPLVALFTSAYTDKHPEQPGLQSQSIAYSNDDGMTWTRYEGNPVLCRDSKDFRDPKVFWHEPSQKWVMVTVEAADRQVLFHGSTDLLHWEQTGSFGPSGPEETLWECPDLVEVPVEDTADTAWVLLLSTNPAGFSGGSGMHYFVGHFDGHTFTSDEVGHRYLDHGPDFYAGVSFHGVESPLIIGWMSNWLYANDTPTHPWQSAMSFARRLSLVPGERALRLRQRPILPTTDSAGVLRTDFALANGESITIQRGEGADMSTLVVLRHDDGTLTVDRTDADPHRVHTALPITEPIPLSEGPVEGVLIDDHGLVEIFLDDGLVTITIQTFPNDGTATIVEQQARPITEAAV